ncbi:unnamed protein product [Rotaria socialis]|uniref:Uncharacterized protein n=1 Tax=Rotaria socialis TaxID=392032 RepID=A0A820YP60_9BILA|nr:unnamed protein product [Rotaria socialis]CAF4545687.1 unnamed protein product [Rotaria socialis]
MIETSSQTISDNRDIPMNTFESAIIKDGSAMVPFTGFIDVLDSILGLRSKKTVATNTDSDDFMATCNNGHDQSSENTFFSISKSKVRNDEADQNASDLLCRTDSTQNSNSDINDCEVDINSLPSSHALTLDETIFSSSNINMLLDQLNPILKRMQHELSQSISNKCQGSFNIYWIWRLKRTIGILKSIIAANKE